MNNMPYEYIIGSLMYVMVCIRAPNRVNIVRFEPKGILTSLKCVYRVTRSTRSPYLYSVKNFPNTTSSLCPTGLWGQIDKHPYEAKQTPHWGRGSALIPFVMTHFQPCRYCPFWAQGALTALKRVYRVTRSSYLYSVRNFPPYLMWDVTVSIHRWWLSLI